MTTAVGRRYTAAVTAVAAASLVGGFGAGAFAARSTVEGVVLIGALACLVVYLTRPHLMVWAVIFLAFASLPAAVPVVKLIGPLAISAHQVALVVAIAFLIPQARLRFSDFTLPGIFVLTVAFSAAVGIANGHDLERVIREASILLEMAAGFVLALLIVRTDYVRQAMRAMAATLWFSAGMILAASLTGLRLAGRQESLQSVTGSAQAIRLLTATQAPAMAVLAALIAAQILGRARLSGYFALGVPALVVTLLGFSRNALLGLAVAAAVAFLASLGWPAVRRSATLTVVVAALVAVVTPAALFLLQHSAAGAWLADQVNAFSHRVVGGVSPNAMAVDQSTLDRLREDAKLQHAIAQAPAFGHGLGYAYQLPFGKPGTFTATFGTTYAHNFYLWWLTKAGALGMTIFAAFALKPTFRGIRSASVEAKISAAVCAALLVVCVVDPLPEESGNSLVLGLALGTALAFARSHADGAAEAVSAAPSAHPLAAHTGRHARQNSV